MARDGNGQFNLPSGNPVTPGTVIESEWANSTMQDLANGLSTSIAYDGQTVPVNNLPMGNFRHTNVGEPSQRNQYATLGMVQDGRDTRVVLSSGTNDLTGTLIGQMSSYFAGQSFTFQALATNTGPATLNINGIGVRNIVLPNGEPVGAGQIALGKFYQVFYTGTQFQLMNASAIASIASKVDQNSISGWVRPEDGVYPPITIVNPNIVRIPAGKGYVVPPGDVDESAIVELAWPAQDVVLQYITSAFTTTIAIDATGTILQIPDQVLGSVYRNAIVLGVVSHPIDVITSVNTRPEVHGDDGYLYRDLTSILSGLLLTGGLVSQSGVNPLSLDVQEGMVFIPGGNIGNADSPNNVIFPTQTAITLRPLAGQSTFSAPTTLAPVGNYDPNFGGVITPIPGGAGTTVIHRLYWQSGTWIWEYGQRTYATLALAVSNLAFERAVFKSAKGLIGASLVCEIIASKNCLAISDQATCIVVPRGGFEYIIGAVGGLSEAPQDGNLYGRKNAAWALAMEPGSPNFTGDIVVTKPQPRVVLDYDPVGAGWSGISFQREGVSLFDLRSTLPEETLSFRTYDDLGVLLSSTTLAQTGDWTFPGVVRAKSFGLDFGAVLNGVGGELIVQAAVNEVVQVAVSNGVTPRTFSYEVDGQFLLPVAPSAALAAANKQYVDQSPKFMTIAMGDETSVATVGIKDTFRMGRAFTLTGVKASLNVAQGAGALFTIDILVNGVSILSTKLTFTNGAETTVGAVTPPVISTPLIPDDAKVQLSITQIGDSTAIGPKLTLIGY